MLCPFCLSCIFTVVIGVHDSVGTGAKARYRSDIRDKLRDMATKETNGSLSSNARRHLSYKGAKSQGYFLEYEESPFDSTSNPEQPEDILHAKKSSSTASHFEARYRQGRSHSLTGGAKCSLLGGQLKASEEPSSAASHERNNIVNCEPPKSIAGGLIPAIAVRGKQLQGIAKKPEPAATEQKKMPPSSGVPGGLLAAIAARGKTISSSNLD